ncbi:5-(carboxyamino)imidazole ribonucleotide synthase [Aliiruegeria haliotis]|uniref:N5-carboxyaminoimidazole ribonucleotide synthase n=1 Tax=Aliiruegeria haliotis TaxID=1280846 RepID=A0A2T0RWQ5_9RHOB|nr:5-(carboxyamino)imidazole ribonucleotide synthase [Aliiruegeria haliotis]PRY25580.1 5-(carboxyamino)imidazole ribonucleotide synthase [Aliiruegeria haliotis]
MSEPLAPGATIGILGGGQLGRMLSVAAARLGYRCYIYEPGAAPAADVAAARTQAPYEDPAALEAFARSVDVVTFEFENVPAEALDRIEAIVPLRPNRKALSVSQDRLTEKEFLSGLGLATAPYANVESLADLEGALKTLGCPSILKTRRLGYDGKGQVRLTDPDQAADAIAATNGAPAVLEGFVSFTSEISVIAARGLSGEISCFDPGENVHEGGILRTTTVPAPIPSRLRTDAVLLAGAILNALDYVGVLGVELFVTPTGLIVNEIAPRVHNSGHWTQNGCAVDQFEQHIRAITGWPLGDGSRHTDVTMENLIGDDMDRVPDLARDPACALHLYGKSETRPGRKMGHANRITPRSA